MTSKEYYQRMAMRDTKNLQNALDKHSEMDSFTLTTRLFDQSETAYYDFMEMKRLQREEQEEKQVPKNYEDAIARGVEMAITKQFN